MIIAPDPAESNLKGYLTLLNSTASAVETFYSHPGSDVFNQHRHNNQKGPAELTLPVSGQEVQC